MELIGNLKTQEMERQVREDKVSQKKKSIAFKATLTFFDNDEEFEHDDDELSLLVKNVWRMFHKKGSFNNRKWRWQGKEQRRENKIGPYYNCQKPSHLIADCPNMKMLTLKKDKILIGLNNV